MTTQTRSKEKKITDYLTGDLIYHKPSKRRFKLAQFQPITQEYREATKIIKKSGLNFISERKEDYVCVEIECGCVCQDCQNAHKAKSIICYPLSEFRL